MKTLLLTVLAAAAPAVAQMSMPMPAGMPMGHGPACARAEIMPGFENWGGAGGPALTVGAPATLALKAATDVRFTPPLTRAATPGSFGGSFPLTITKRGTYAVALGAPAWVDLVAGGQRLTSVAHQHGAMCSGVTKIVEYTLAPGTYQVQLSEMKEPTLKAMVIAR